MTIWPPSRERLKRPAYRAIVQALIEAVEAGEIVEGEKLPPQRTLAFDLGLSVHTVSRAYEELTRIGLIRGEIGRGSFVTSGSTEAATPWQTVGEGEAVIDLSMLVPVRSPRHDETMRAALADLARKLPDATINSFRPRTTLRRHCDTASQWLERCGVSAPRERILPTNGCTSAMAVALLTAAVPGNHILTEAMGHHTIKPLCSALGMRLTGVSMDKEGLLPDAVDDAAKQGARALMVMPSGLGPTTAFMSEARRAALVDVARRRDLMIIENDAWAPLTNETVPTLAAMAPERTLYITGLSKITLAGLRIGWLVVPDRLISAARARHLVTAWMATPLIAEIATRWIADGTVCEMLAFQKEQFSRRNALVRKAFTGLDFRSLDSGMHVWLNVPEDWKAADFVAHARNEGVAVAGSSNFEIAGRSGSDGIRICVGGATEAALNEGLKILSLIAKSAPEPVLLTM